MFTCKSERIEDLIFVSCVWPRLMGHQADNTHIYGGMCILRIETHDFAHLFAGLKLYGT